MNCGDNLGQIINVIFAPGDIRLPPLPLISSVCAQSRLDVGSFEVSVGVEGQDVGPTTS